MFPFTLRAIRSWAAVLACAAVAWGGTAAPAAPASPALPARATTRIELDPTTGPPGSRVGVRGYGFGDCRSPVQGAVGDLSKTQTPAPTRYRADVIEVRIAPGGGGPSVITADLDTGGFETDVTAPSDASAGTYTVTATCTTPNTSLSATAQFKVKPTPVPGLVLDRTSGPVRTAVRVTGSGFDYCAVNGSGKAQLTWDGRPLDGVEPAAVDPEQGSFTAGIEVPADAEPGDGHKVKAACLGYESLSAEAPFTVEKPTEPTDGPTRTPPTTDEPTKPPPTTDEPTKPPPTTDEPTKPPPTTDEPTKPPERPDVVLSPPEGPAGGDPVTVTGSGFNCPLVNVLWRGGLTGQPVRAEGDGSFAMDLVLAADVPEGSYRVRAQCQSDPDVADEATFRVTATPSLPPPPPKPSPDSAPTPTLTPAPTPGPTDGPTPPPTPGPTDGPTPDPTPTDDQIVLRVVLPRTLVVGASLVAVALLAAFAISRLVQTHHRRSPPQGQDHVSARLRPAPAATTVAEPAAGDDAAGSHTIRLEPHADPGEQTVRENEEDT
ncbi:hypothetical protein [Streptomyces sp. NPDC007369]|uniref:hypothetical protein n=1 Tax=Streptomyces sp. NPDC007369 TaxID=3154589 RepID=UPI0033E4924C